MKTIILVNTIALWGPSSHHVTVGVFVDVVEIGLPTHLRYIRPRTRTDGTEAQNRLHPNYTSDFCQDEPVSVAEH